MNRFSIAAVFAGCLWGTTGLFSRYMDPLGFSPLDMLIVRCGIAAVLFGCLILLKNVRLFHIRWKDLWLFLAVGLTGQLMFSYCYYTAIDMMSISTACVLLYTSPAIVMLLARLLFRERIGRRGALALVLCVSGSALVSGLGGSASPAGVLYGLGAGLCFALINITTRALIQRGYDSLTISFYLCLLAAGTAVLIFGAQTPVRVMAAGGSGLVLCLASGIGNGFLPYLLFTYSLSGCESGKASILASTEPVVATLTGVLLFHEKLGLAGAAGVLLVLGSIVLMNTGRSVKKETA